MTTKFESPYIFKGQKDQLVLMYGEYIMGELTQEMADRHIKSIAQDLFVIEPDKKVFSIKDVRSYEFEHDDEHIFFKVGGDKVSESIDFKDLEELLNAEKIMAPVFKELGLIRKEGQLTALQAAVSPTIIMTIVVALGALLSWFAYGLQGYQPTHAKAVKWYVYIFYQIVQFTGYIPFVVLTVVSALLCLIWAFRRMLKPPYRVIAVKKKQ